MYAIRSYYALLSFLIFTISWSQTPEKVSYQTIIRDNANQLLANHRITSYNVCYTKLLRAQDKRFQWTIGIFLLLYLPKIILTLTLFSEDIFRLSQGVFRYFSKSSGATASFLPERRRFVSQMALALAAVPFTSLLYA